MPIAAMFLILVFYALLAAYLVFLWNFLCRPTSSSLAEQRSYIDAADRRLTCLLMWIRAKKRNMVNGTSWDGRSKD